MRKAQIPDIFVIIAIAILFSLGVFVLYTTTPIGVVNKSWLDSSFVKQLLFGVVAGVVLLILVSIDLQFLRTLVVQGIGWGGTILLLVGLFLLGGLVNDTHRWYRLGAFLLQPSEFAKIVSALWISYWLTQDKASVQVKLLCGIGGIGLIAGLIVTEPDFGATIVILIIALVSVLAWMMKYEKLRDMIITSVVAGIVVVAAAKLSWLVLILLVPWFIFRLRVQFMHTVIAGGIVLAISGLIFGSIALWNSSYRKVIPSYVRERLESFSGESEEKFQIKQAKIAVGSGQFWGKGLAQGTQSRLRFLPEYTTDFIFAALVEERGYAGMILLLLVYLLLYTRLLFLALSVEDEFTRIAMIALTVKLWFETFVNIGMNMGVLPTKGFALPFVSYGGSSLLANTIIIGIMLSLYRFEVKRDTISSLSGRLS